MRIISGKYKGRQLKGFEIDGTRPTMDRIKESLFAMIQMEIKDSDCLDLYAGSGALGLEALSNGAKSCLFVDQNTLAIQALKENTKEILSASIIKINAFQLHNQIKKSFDLVFLDPPYQLNLIGPSLQYLEKHHFLRNNAIIVCEFEEENFSYESFELVKQKQYGKKKIIILKKR